MVEPTAGTETTALSDADEDVARSWVVYRWSCPACGDVDEDEVEQPRVTCGNCGFEFSVSAS